MMEQQKPSRVDDLKAAVAPSLSPPRSASIRSDKSVSFEVGPLRVHAHEWPACTYPQEGGGDGGIAHGAERCASAPSDVFVTQRQICVSYMCRSSPERMQEIEFKESIQTIRST